MGQLSSGSLWRRSAAAFRRASREAGGQEAPSHGAHLVELEVPLDHATALRELGAVEDDVVPPDADAHLAQALAALEGLLDLGIVCLAVDPPVGVGQLREVARAQRLPDDAAPLPLRLLVADGRPPVAGDGAHALGAPPACIMTDLRQGHGLAPGGRPH
eukprot:16445470-Heterocapsa_arctica.AAC.1